MFCDLCLNFLSFLCNCRFCSSSITLRFSKAIAAAEGSKPASAIRRSWPMNRPRDPAAWTQPASLSQRLPLEGYQSIRLVCLYTYLRSRKVWKAMLGLHLRLNFVKAAASIKFEIFFSFLVICFLPKSTFGTT